MTHATVDSHADHLNLGLFRFGPNYHNMSKQGRTGPFTKTQPPRAALYGNQQPLWLCPAVPLLIQVTHIHSDLLLHEAVASQKAEHANNPDHLQQVMGHTIELALLRWPCICPMRSVQDVLS